MMNVSVYIGEKTKLFQRINVDSISLVKVNEKKKITLFLQVQRVYIHYYKFKECFAVFDHITTIAYG